jgi:hypothetical protein
MARIRKNPEYKGVKVKVTGSFVIDQHRFSFTGCSGREACERLRAYIGNVQQHAEELPVSALSGNFRRATILLPEDRDDGAVISVCINSVCNGHTYDYTRLIPVLHQLCEIYDFPELAEILNAGQQDEDKGDTDPTPAAPPKLVAARFDILEAETRVLMDQLGYLVELMRREDVKEALDHGLRTAHARTKRLITQVTTIKADL